MNTWPEITQIMQILRRFYADFTHRLSMFQHNYAEITQIKQITQITQKLRKLRKTASRLHNMHKSH